jgi:predicted CXXCH cytochrome family protein
MPRAALICLLLFVLVAPVDGAGPNPHLDLSLVTGSCMACHEGHGASRSPMLPGPQQQVCLACHGSRSALVQMMNRDLVASDAEPPLLDRVLALPFLHPLSDTAHSSDETGEVTCSSCHSPHRGSVIESSVDNKPTGLQRISPSNPLRFEFEMCESCHGSGGATTQSLTDISRLLSPENASYHPVEAPSMERSPSLMAELSGRYINCTDCHGSSDDNGPRGPHGSAVPFILRANYTTTDGAAESESAYALCYSCHQRKAVLESSLFPQHGKHIVDIGASCATCHNGHGSVINRALIRFGEETYIGGVEPSSSNRLELVSIGPGSGACYLSCHGVNHDPKTYGSMELLLGIVGDERVLVPAQTRDRARRPIRRER